MISILPKKTINFDASRVKINLQKKRFVSVDSPSSSLLFFFGGWVQKVKLKPPHFHVSNVFRFNPRSRCNSSSRCCYRACEHVDQPINHSTQYANFLFTLIYLVHNTDEVPGTAVPRSHFHRAIYDTGKKSQPSRRTTLPTQN